MIDPIQTASTSRSITETINGSHRFSIKGYSLAKGMGIGKHIASENFKVGGYEWAIYFYPDGKNQEENPTYVSVFIALASEGIDVRALFELALVDQSGKERHKVHSHFDRSPECGPYTLKCQGSMWGYKRFFRRTMLETSDFLKDDCLKINCTVGVVVSATVCSRSLSIKVPDSDIGTHFGMLLENEEGSDVTFDVCGKTFHAHRLILAIRSPLLEAELLNKSEEGGHNILITDMEPNVFKAMLRFIYTDDLPKEVLAVSCSASTPTNNTLPEKLLAAAHKYGLTRLRIMCESLLCRDISVNSVAKILAFADHYHVKNLKSICLKFAAENLVAVMRSVGFEHLRERPMLQSAILQTFGGFEGEFSGHGNSQSHWAQCPDVETNDRRGKRLKLSESLIQKHFDMQQG